MAGFDFQGRDAGGRRLWAVVLAGGHGERLRHFVRETLGLDTPKQFVALMGRRSMFQNTVDRAELVVPPERIVVVADAAQAETVSLQLRGRAVDSVCLQPVNRETAAGVMLALAHILSRDPDAVVVVLPSDHFVLEEERFMSQAVRAAEAAACLEGGVVLLGARPESAESDYGWIEPGPALHCPRPCGVRRVRRFVKKPTPAEAAAAFRAGALWNTFVVAARAEALFSLAAGQLPELGRAFGSILRAVGTASYGHVLRAEYAHLPTAGLSKEVFETSAESVAVLPLEGVTWSDWGSARRILETHAALGRRPAWPSV